MNDDERTEYEALLRRAAGDPANGGKVTSSMARTLDELLLDAEQAGRPWAVRVMDEDRIEGHRRRLKEWLKVQSVVLFANDGQVIGKATRVGSRRPAGDGSAEWQQKLIHDMSWAEVDDWLEMLGHQLHGLRTTVAMGRRLKSLHQEHPGTYGPTEACARVGTTLDEYLGAEAAS